MPQKSHGKAPSRRKAAETPVPPPEWPALQPLRPSEDLTSETLLDGQIIVIRNLFTSTLCKKYVASLSSLPLITTPAQAKAGNALRVNDRIQFDDPDFAEQLWSNTALEQLVNSLGDGSKKVWGGEVCGLNPRIRVYRYGQLSLHLLR